MDESVWLDWETGGGPLNASKSEQSDYAIKHLSCYSKRILEAQPFSLIFGDQVSSPLLRLKAILLMGRSSVLGWGRGKSFQFFPHCNGLHLYFIQSALQCMPLIHPFTNTFTHQRRLAAMQGTNQLVRSNWELGVLLRDTLTCPGWDRTGNPPTARRYHPITQYTI